MPHAQPVEGVPITRPTHWLVLGLVIEQPAHGYEIITRYDRRIGPYLPMSRASVYSALDRLTEHGLAVPYTPVVTDLREMRVTYQATAVGLAAYKKWLLSPTHPRHWREELLGRLTTGGILGHDGLLKLIDLYEQAVATHARHVGAQDSNAVSDNDNAACLACLLAVQEQAQVASAQLAWAQAARRRLQCEAK